MSGYREAVDEVIREVKKAVVGKPDTIEKIMMAILQKDMCW